MKITHRSVRLWQRPAIVIILLVALAGMVQAQDEIEADTSSTFLVTPAALQEKQPTVWSQFSYSLSGIATTESDRIDNGFGFGATGTFDGFLPVVPSIGVDFLFSSIDAPGLSDGEFRVFSPTLDLTVHGTLGRLRPFAGAGVNLYFNDVVFDEAAEFRIDGYDSLQQARSVDMGWGAAPHLRLGLIVPVANKIGIMVQSRFQWVSHTSDIVYRDSFTGEEWTNQMKYDMPSVWFSVGLVGGACVRETEGD